MLIDSNLVAPITDTKAAAAAIEAAGFDGLWLGETKHEPFLQLLQAAEATERVSLGTGIAIAFARTPMTLANAGYDMARYSQGRFILGLGSQVKPHITKRFSMPWSHPAARMRELIVATRAIWANWQDGTPLEHRGEFYTHTLMTPFFSPPAHEFGPPPVYLAGVGALMTEVAGEVCDGFLYHPFTTDRYLRDVTIPALARGRAKAGKEGFDGFDIGGPAFACTGRDEKELAAAIAGTKNQIAFYASTPAYKPVLDMHGWGDLQPELSRMTRDGRWAEIGTLIDDEVLHAFAVVGEPAAVGRGLVERWGSIATRLTLYAPYPHDPAVWPEVTAAMRA
ncbi:MAG: LLM class F420-dependent oxidoreductase [Actinomycetota bacterium]|nr:LLM class F420-dependent oxidoreductase [Actinomycetota bacterium]